MNARTNTDWKEENAGHLVRGRYFWLSPPLKVKLKTFNFDVTLEPEGGLESYSAVGVPNAWSTATTASAEGSESGDWFVSQSILLVAVVSAVVLLVFLVMRRRGSEVSIG